MTHFHDRYCAGQRQSVWHELALMGGAIRESPVIEDATAVAHETMRRARQNVETIIQRLTMMGYKFRPDPRCDSGPPSVAPPEDLPVILAAVESRWGPVPLSIRAWWEVVGGVNLMGWHPDLPAYSDPLVVELPDIDYFDDEFECMDEPEVFPMPMAPDYYHKDNVSGGGPYAIDLPSPSMDAVFRGDWSRLVGCSSETCFVDYLRIAFRYGGFPGLAKCEATPAGFATLHEGLLEI